MPTAGRSFRRTTAKLWTLKQDVFNHVVCMRPCGEGWYKRSINYQLVSKSDKPYFPSSFDLDVEPGHSRSPTIVIESNLD